MESLTYIASLIMVALGTLHLIYALYDLFIHPRYFKPADKALLAAMRKTRPAISPHARDYWLAVVGFNISHAMGVLLFGLLIVLSAEPQNALLRPVVPLIALGYTLLSWRCWFFIPTIGAALTTILLALAWYL